MVEPYKNYYLNLLEDDLNELLSYCVPSEEPSSEGVKCPDSAKSENHDHSSIERSISTLISQVSSFHELSTGSALPRGSQRFSLSMINSILSSSPEEIANGDMDADSQSDPDSQLFYQCGSGELLFLRSLDYAVLRAQCKHELKTLPHTICLRVYNVSNSALIGGGKRRYRYLDHLSLCSEAGFCDTELMYASEPHVLEQLGEKLRLRKLQLKALTAVHLEKLALSDDNEVPKELNISFSPDSFTMYETHYPGLEPHPPLDVLDEWPEVGSVAKKFPSRAATDYSCENSPCPESSVPRQRAVNPHSRLTSSFAKVAAVAGSSPHGDPDLLGSPPAANCGMLAPQCESENDKQQQPWDQV